MKIEWNSVWEEFSTLLGTCRHTCSVTHLCLTVCDPTDYSPLGSSVRGIFQVTHLEWVAMPSSRGIPGPGVKPASPASLASQVASLPLSHRGGPLAHSRPSWRLVSLLIVLWGQPRCLGAAPHVRAPWFVHSPSPLPRPSSRTPSSVPWLSTAASWKRFLQLVVCVYVSHSGVSNSLWRSGL